MEKIVESKEEIIRKCEAAINGDYTSWTIGTKRWPNIQQLIGKYEVKYFFCSHWEISLEIVSYFMSKGVELDYQHIPLIRNLYLKKIA